MGSKAASTYSGYLDRIRVKDPTVLLGSLVWYTVAESTRIKHTDLAALLTTVGLDVLTPPAPRDDDVFRRVTTNQQRKRVETDDPDVFENYLIRDVSRSEGRVVKQIVVEQVNGKGNRLDYTPAVSLEFTSTTGKIAVTALTDPANPQAMNVAELIRKDFRREKGSVNAYGIRELMRKAITNAGALVVRPTGGVYFVPESQRATIDALAALSKGVRGTTFHPVPLLNDTDQQAMLRDAIEGETRTELEKVLDEIDRLMDGPEIPAAKYAAMVEHMNHVKARTGEYAELLDDALHGCELLVGSYDAKMRKLFMHVASDTL